MKLATVISKLEKLRKAYVKQYGFEPHVQDFEVDGDHLVVELCKSYKLNGFGCTTFAKPYKTNSIRTRRLSRDW